MIRTIILALALVPASLAAKPLPQEAVEHLLGGASDVGLAIYAIENREDGGPVDDILVSKLTDAADMLYEAATEGQFVCDDHPERCGDSEPAEQPWFCEDYLANDLTPFPGCVHEPRGKSK